MSSFSLNFQQLLEIDTTPNGSTRTWIRFGAGISSVDPENNENIDQTAYIVDGGFSSSEVIGAQKILSWSGHRLVGDAAQDYIFSKEYDLGSSRKTNIRFYDAGGNLTTGGCTIANLKAGGGDAAAKTEISGEFHMNGKPVYTPKSIAPALSATIEAGTAVGTTKATASPGATNTLKYNLTSATVGTVYLNQFLDGGINYTSGDDIIATVGQFLQVYEVNSYGRVQKFTEHELASGDIAST